jgi:predicted enzyme related to lactoylglutathione lyase
MSGRVVHFEIPVDDTDRAADFYRSAFSWQLDSMPEVNYTMIRSTPTDDQGMPQEPGSINGGMFKREDQLTNPVITIDVEDIDSTLAKIGTLGGSTVLPKQPVGDMGFAAYFRDTEGNVVGLWQNPK